MLLVLFNKFKVCYLYTYYITPLSIKIKSYYLTFYTAYTANNKMQRNWTCVVSPTGREHLLGVIFIRLRTLDSFLQILSDLVFAYLQSVKPISYSRSTVTAWSRIIAAEMKCL